MTDQECETTTDLEPVAYHEAGHAVVMCLLGVPFEEVSIVKSCRSLGHVAWNTPDGYCHASPSQRKKCIMCHLAGVVVGKMLVQPRTRYETDDIQAYQLATYLAKDREDDQEVQCIRNCLETKTKKLIEQTANWAAIEVLARVLLKELTVSAGRVGRIVAEYSPSETDQLLRQ